jgi:CubicO group peptidase (beta-lactamase class C family)
MNVRVIFVLLLVTTLGANTRAEQTDDFDYFSDNRQMIRNGVQAVLTCNGLFTSERNLEQVFAQELKFLQEPLGSAEGGNYLVDTHQKLVSVGGETDGKQVTAAFRDGIGCVVLGPQQTVNDIDNLPSIKIPDAEVASSELPWPMGDVLLAKPLSSNVDSSKLLAASNWAFERDTKEQDTLSMIVLHKGQIIHERYADGFDMNTRTRTWSTAKSIAASLIGSLVETGKLNLDAPLTLSWLPELGDNSKDPRTEITLRHLLNMSSGLYPVDSLGMEYATGSGLAYWAGASSVKGALTRGLIRQPGLFWDYENYDTLLAVKVMKEALGNEKAYHQFPYTELLNKIGMRNTLISTDRFGDFILSSQVYTNARDLARFGLLYQQGGVWNGERLVSENWIKFIRTPAPATKHRGNLYGAQWWLVPDERKDVPKDAYATAGNRGQYVIVVPSHELVIVRRGLDYGKQGFDRWDLTREVLKAFKALPIDD